ncbi:hypothetical protein DICVIV_03733 [Dictyocaulus viviparus]|uniref:Uncharacterized protein n=1 Tax=Dictyocaulus viviparus TaxID=29172 RepID=A0A0D8Y679_DICVI|nr:hypothetical protein DICVIV_03733 [Dictyocaulus viviparus]
MSITSLSTKDVQISSQVATFVNKSCMDFESRYTTGLLSFRSNFGLNHMLHNTLVNYHESNAYLFYNHLRVVLAISRNVATHTLTALIVMALSNTYTERV